jgi:DNA-binding IclR family transcriptional regulator
MKTGIHAVASPVFGPGGKLIGSILVVGTFPGQYSEKYGPKAAKIARDFSEAIGGGNGHTPYRSFQKEHP